MSNGDTWERLNGLAGLDRPLPHGTRLRRVRRLFLRLIAPALQQQAEFNRAVMAQFVEMAEQLSTNSEASRAELMHYADLLRAAIEDLQGKTDQLAPIWLVDVVQRHGWEVDAIRDAIELHAVDREAIHQEVLLGQQQSFARIQDAVGLVRTEMAEISAGWTVANADLVQRADETVRSISDLRARLSTVDLLLNTVRRHLPEPPPATELEHLPTAVDNLYGSLEEAMRGSEEVVRSRVKPYVEDILSASGTGPVLDVGCGRGELLWVLKDAGIEAYGVERSPLYEELWRERGLDVRMEDLRTHLEDIPAGSLRAITAIHVAEHLPVEALIDFLDLALRALSPGGLLILETPNPENLIVGACTFYLDPTHNHPLPPRLLSYLVEARGYAKVETRYLSRPEMASLPTPEVGEPGSSDLRLITEAINRHLFAPQDYAVVARRI